MQRIGVCVWKLLGEPQARWQRTDNVYLRPFSSRKRQVGENRTGPVSLVVFLCCGQRMERGFSCFLPTLALTREAEERGRSVPKQLYSPEGKQHGPDRAKQEEDKEQIRKGQMVRCRLKSGKQANLALARASVASPYLVNTQ